MHCNPVGMKVRQTSTPVTMTEAPAMMDATVRQAVEWRDLAGTQIQESRRTINGTVVTGTRIAVRHESLDAGLPNVGGTGR